MKTRLSLGTAIALGLSTQACTDLPTTGYLLEGEGCANACAFCPQSSVSKHGSGRLSRVTWPEYDLEAVMDAIGQRPGVLKRLCLQATDSLRMADILVQRLEKFGPLGIPVCISASLHDIKGVRHLLNSGADKVSIALDAATPVLYSQIKGRDWDKSVKLLEAAAREFPGRIATHIIAGLGETEADITAVLSRMGSLGVTTALFAFTPVRGTPLANRKPPDLSSWRRLQVANFLLTTVDWRLAGGFVYNESQQIKSFGISNLREQLMGGEAFMTSGCPDCNRPYYNERPGTELYNYPRRLTETELKQALARLEVTV